MARQFMTSKNKEEVREWAVKRGRKVLWKDNKGYWHAATDRQNTPQADWVVETEDI